MESLEYKKAELSDSEDSARLLKVVFFVFL